MNIYSPVSNIMTSNLITVGPNDLLSKVNEIFAMNRIHHLPVVEGKKLVGMLSKSDFLKAIHGVSLHGSTEEENTEILNKVKVKELMVKGIAHIESKDHIAVAVEIFLENLFHAVPIVDNGKLVGIVTTFDIMRFIIKEEG